MIFRDNAIIVLLEACPSFQAAWDEHKREWDDERLIYIEFGLFANHLIDLYQKQQLEDFPAVFAVIERLHVDGEPFVKEAATIGLLEGLQNIAGNRGIAPDALVLFLQPESLRWWINLNRFWSGETKTVGGS